MSKPDGKGSKASKNKSGQVRPTVSRHDVPKVVSVDRQTETADADTFSFADVAPTSSSSGNRKTAAGRRPAASPGTRSNAAQRGRGKSKKDFELMVAYGTIGAFVLVAVIGLVAMLSGGDSPNAGKSQNNRRSQIGNQRQDPSRYMQNNAEQRRLIEQRKNWSRGDVAFPDAEDDVQAEPKNSSSGDFQLPPPHDGRGSIGAGLQPAEQPFESARDSDPRR